MEREGGAMSEFQTLQDFAAAPEIRDAIEAMRRDHIVALRQAQFGARRGVVSGALELPAAGTVWRSLWLLTHRPLRRAGIRRHAASAVVLVAWRGQGLVLLRGPHERRSVELAPVATATETAVPCVYLAPGTHFDTLADETPWHVLVFHSEPAANLMREEETQEGWIAKLEEADS